MLINIQKDKLGKLPKLTTINGRVIKKSKKKHP
jgi:hypothetical protein